MTDAEAVALLVQDIAWLVVVCYAGYKIARVYGWYRTRERMVEATIAGAGGLFIWWSRVLYGFEGAEKLVLALLVIGVALIALPKLLGIATSDLRRLRGEAKERG